MEGNIPSSMFQVPNSMQKIITAFVKRSILERISLPEHVVYPIFSENQNNLD